MKFKTYTNIPLEYIGQPDSERIIGTYTCQSIHELQNYLKNCGIKLTNQQIYRHIKRDNDPILGYVANKKNNAVCDFKHQQRFNKAHEILIQFFKA